MNQENIIKLLKLLGAKKMKRRDNWVTCSCPFAPWTHEKSRDINPSFGISIDTTSFYNCFACGKKGHITKLPTIYEWYSKRNMYKLREIISNTDGAVLKERGKTFSAEAVDEDVLKTFSKLKAGVRRLTKIIIEKYGLLYDAEENRLVIPVRDIYKRLISLRGRYLGKDNKSVKYREYSELTKCSPKKCGIWYGSDIPLVEGKKLILVEGELDAIFLREFGVRNVWAAMGASVTSAQVSSVINTHFPIVLYFDDDKAGKASSQEIYNKCKSTLEISHVRDYGGCKDAGQAFGKGVLKKVLSSVEII